MLWAKRGLNSWRFNVLPMPQSHEVAVSTRQVLVVLTGELQRGWPPINSATVLAPRLLTARLALSEE